MAVRVMYIRGSYFGGFLLSNEDVIAIACPSLFAVAHPAKNPR